MYIVYRVLYIGVCVGIFSLYSQCDSNNEREIAPNHIQKTCRKLLSTCDLAPLQAENITIYVQELPKGLYAYAKIQDMSITINAYYCIGSTWVAWLVSWGFPFVFYHEVMHLKHYHEFGEDEKEIANLYCEMEADLGSFEILLKQKRLLTLAFCLGKITLDALLNVHYDYAGQPSAKERCVYWWGFCKEYIVGNNPSYKEYAQLYLHDLQAEFLRV